MTPIIGIGGQAGAGKDTVAGMMMKLQPGSVSIAQADPIKWLGRYGFDFTEDQLWGPSENRNGLDRRYLKQNGWDEAYNNLFGTKVAEQWLEEVGIGDVKSLEVWFDELESEFADSGTFSPRIMLQRLGTEYARSHNPAVWSELAIKRALKLLGGNCTYNRLHGIRTDYKTPLCPMVFITDVRFPNELIKIKTIGGKGLKVASSELTVSTSHASEASLGQIPDFWWDVILYNNKQDGLDNLRTAVRKMYSYLVPQPFAQKTKPFVLGQE